MALLTVNERKAIFKELGLGEYNEKNIKAFQKKYMARKSDVDGKYGTNTDNTLRTVYYTKVYTKNFKPEEFKCECGGRYCCGYPSYMKPAELIHIQAIRDHYGRPITVTCGLRCKTWNSKLGGSIQNSLHMSGLAIDFYQSGVTDTLKNRKASIKWIKGRVNHHYTYGNGINSYGNGVSAPYMGNALHTDCYDKVEPIHPTWTESPSTEATQPSAPIVTPQPAPTADRVKVDGIGGKDTVTVLQKFLGATADGVISGQTKTLSKYYPGMTAVEFGKGGSYTVKLMQKWLGIGQDGIWGEGTSKALQKKIGTTADGIFGYGSVKALQTYLNKNDKAVYPKQTIVEKELEACAVQSKWMKNAVYSWPKWNPKTVAQSKKAGTCVTFVACVLQRIGILKVGQYLWHNGRGYGDGKVVGANSKIKITYMGNKTLTSLKSKLKAGDIVFLDDNKSGERGSGGHIMILTGKWTEAGNPYVWDNETAKKGQKPRAYNGKRKVLAIGRLEG